MTQLTPYTVAGILNAISSFIFGLFVLWRSSNRRLGRIWFLFSITITFYGAGLAWIGAARSVSEAARAWAFLYGCGILWIAPALYHFVTVFVDRPNGRWVRVHYAIALLFCGALSSPYFFTGYRWFFDSFFFANAGPLFVLFLLWWMGLVIATHWMMIRAYPGLPRMRQNQVKYFMLATVLGFCGGSYGYLANFGFDLYPWGNYVVSIYPAIMAAAILRHQLLDVQVIIRKAILYSALTVILAAIFMMSVFAATRLLEGWIQSAGTYSSIVAAGMIGALFHPLQVRLQRWVNRLFPGESIDQAFLREATGRFVHEIKRPLARIATPVQLALNDLNDLASAAPGIDRDKLEKLRGRLLFVLSETMEAAEHIEAVRHISTASTALEPVDLAATLKGVLAVYDPDFRRHAISIETSLPSPLPLISGHYRQLEIVLSNVIRNAIGALGKVGGDKPRRLRIEADVQSAQLILRLIDNGPGIPAADLPRLFEPNFTSKGLEGMGLGLYLVERIMRLHGGQVEARTGEGATFILTFPFSREGGR